MSPDHTFPDRKSPEPSRPQTRLALEVGSPSIGLGLGNLGSTGPTTSEHVTEKFSIALGQLLEDKVVRTGAAPGATAGIARRVGNEWRWAVGAAGNTDPFDGDLVTADTWYDLASLTKSMTALGVARAVDGGQ